MKTLNRSSSAKRLKSVSTHLKALGILVAQLSLGYSLRAGEVSLAWRLPTTNIDGTPVTDLAGCKVYWGLSSRNYSQVLDLPGVAGTNVLSVTNYQNFCEQLPNGQPVVSIYRLIDAPTNCTITGLQENVTYYFAGTCYNTVGNESDFSDEVFRAPYLYIRRQPNSTNLVPPNPITFSVWAGGKEPIFYKWRRNEEEIPGATNDTYTLSRTAFTDNGSKFDVVVNNYFMAITSLVAELTVGTNGLKYPVAPTKMRLTSIE